MAWLISSALMQDFENSRSLPGQAAAFSAATSSDGEPSAPSNSTPTPQAYLSPDRMTAFSRLSRFGMTFGPLTADRGEELLTWFRAGFPVRTSASPEKAQASTANAPASGPSSLASLAKFDHATSTWRTPQLSLLADSDESSVIWPRSGSMRDGVCWELPMLAHRTRGTDSGSWPTPTVNGNYNRKGASPTSGDGLATAVAKWPTPKATEGSKGGPNSIHGNGSLSLSAAVARFPTPQASDNRNRGTASTPAIARRIEAGKQVMLSMTMAGPLNPTWVEWLMGWPLAWTDLKPLATAKFRQWQLEHGSCSMHSTSICPPAEIHTSSSMLADNTHQQLVCLCEGALDAVANTGPQQ